MTCLMIHLRSKTNIQLPSLGRSNRLYPVFCGPASLMSNYWLSSCVSLSSSKFYSRSLISTASQAKISINCKPFIKLYSLHRHPMMLEKLICIPVSHHSFATVHNILRSLAEVNVRLQSLMWIFIQIFLRRECRCSELYHFLAFIVLKMSVLRLALRKSVVLVSRSFTLWNLYGQYVPALKFPCAGNDQQKAINGLPSACLQILFPSALIPSSLVMLNE